MQLGGHHHLMHISFIIIIFPVTCILKKKKEVHLSEELFVCYHSMNLSFESMYLSLNQDFL